MTTNAKLTRRERMQKIEAMYEEYKNNHPKVGEFTEFVNFSALMFAYEFPSKISRSGIIMNPFKGSIEAILGYASVFAYYDYIAECQETKNIPTLYNGNPNCAITDNYLDGKFNVDSGLHWSALKLTREIIGLNSMLHSIGMPRVLTKNIAQTEQSTESHKIYVIDDCKNVCREIIDEFARFSENKKELPKKQWYSKDYSN